MNWLAHLYLSEPSPAFRIGNLLPDLAAPSVLEPLPPEFHRGITQHRRIDAFTDSHPIARRSAARIEQPLRRYAPIIVDLFYDHFLTRDWHLYSASPLRDFAEEFYASIDTFRPVLPDEIYEHLSTMRAGDWICTYHDLNGLAKALTRISARLRRPVDLSPAVSTLQRDYAEFSADFRAFFPELTAHLRKRSVKHSQ
jgi:acyl carrier protein phosphodiesterase